MKLANNIAEQTHVVLDGCGDDEVGFQLAVERKLELVGAPNIAWSVESGDTGFFRALAGKRRDFLAIRDGRFREYTVLVSARPTGTALHVSWILLADARLLNDLRRVARVEGADGDRLAIGAECDAFAMLDLVDFIAVTRLAFRAAIREFARFDDEAFADRLTGGGSG
jgi:hypothetical protein